MEITSVDTFVAYYKKVRSRTRNLIDRIPLEKIEWTYHPDKFTIGELIRHLATTERYLYAEAVSLRSYRYPGWGTDLAQGYTATVAFMDRLHEESCQLFLALTPEDLIRKCKTPAGTPITTWKWMRAMIEHEVHHRGQLYTYLGMLEVDVPPLYGLTAEQVAAQNS